MKKNILILVCLFCSGSLFSQEFPVTFETLSLPGDQSFWNGSDGKSDFRSNGFLFRNHYDTAYDYWSGFAYGNIKDSITEGFGNQYAAFTGGGINGTEKYAVGYNRAVLVRENSTEFKGAFIANSTYTALAMKKGDAFSKKFGGASGNDPDYLRLLAIGFKDGIQMDTAYLSLADYTHTDSKQDYILHDWTWFDFTALKSADSLMFTFESSDTGFFGINTPLYFCMDDFNGVAPSLLPNPELTFETFALDSNGFWNGSRNEGGFLMQNVYFENQYNTDWNSWSGWSVSNHKDTFTADFGNGYSVISGKGYDKGNQYLTFYDRGAVRLPYNRGISTVDLGFGLMVNNSTYAYHSMKRGDAFSKKFGGKDGKDKDYFMLTIKGMDIEGDIVGTIDFYLADFRFDDDKKDYIIRDWTLMDVSNLVLNQAIRLEFSLSSSDTGTFGMNTPAFFCMDQFLKPLSDLKAKTVMPPSVKVYPNPAGSQVYTGLDGRGTVEIMDAAGKTMAAGEVDLSAALDISYLPSGIYRMRIMQGNQIYSAKFVKI
jgi:hypothetical protein